MLFSSSVIRQKTRDKTKHKKAKKPHKTKKQKRKKNKQNIIISGAFLPLPNRIWSQQLSTLTPPHIIIFAIFAAALLPSAIS